MLEQDDRPTTGSSDPWTSDLRTDALALIGRLDAARGSGASEQEVVDLLITAGWRPLIPASGPSTVIDGVLSDGRHVPVRIVGSRTAGAIRSAVAVQVVTREHAR